MGMQATAQIAQKVAIGQTPKIVTLGSFNDGVITSKVVAKEWDLIGTNPLFTKLDTATTAAPDTPGTSITGNCNGVGMQVDLTKLAGRSDSVTVTFEGSKTKGVSWIVLSTQTAANVTTLQSFEYNFAAGAGNLYTNVRSIIKVGNLAGGSSVSWREYLLIRFKDIGLWEVTSGSGRAARTIADNVFE